MLTRFMRSTAHGGKYIQIHIAEEIRQAGIRRAVDSIDPELLDDAADHVQAALKDNKLLSPAHTVETTIVTITSMFHTSKKDPGRHITCRMQDENGRHVATGHVNADIRKQEVEKWEIKAL